MEGRKKNTARETDRERERERERERSRDVEEFGFSHFLDWIFT